jgi:hypothetical protein
MYSYESRTTIEVATAGVVAGYAPGRWSIGASLRVGLGRGSANSSGPGYYTNDYGFFDPTMVFALETGYGF